MNKKTTAPKGPSTPLTAAAAATTVAIVVASAAPPPPPPPQQKAQVQLLERVLPSLVEFTGKTLILIVPTAKTLILLAPSPYAPLVHKLNPSLPI